MTTPPPADVLYSVIALDAAEIAAEAAYWAGRADQSVIVMDRYRSDLAGSIARHPSNTEATS